MEIANPVHSMHDVGTGKIQMYRTPPIHVRELVSYQRTDQVLTQGMVLRR